MIITLHALAFFEFPSSFSWTSDIRTRSDRLALPCGVTEGIEMFCLLFLTADVIIKVCSVRTNFGPCQSASLTWVNTLAIFEFSTCESKILPHDSVIS